MANLLRKYHYPDLANLVGDHDSWDFGKWRTWEEKILRYADAHVEGDKIVSLEQRIVNAKPNIRDRILNSFGKNLLVIKKNWRRN